MLIGEKILLWHARPDLNRALNLWINFTFFNEGATPGAVFELSGTILPVNGGKKVDIKWRSFLEDKNIAAPGEMVRYRIINLGEPSPITITSRAVGGVETRFISMQTTEQIELSKGDYKLVFRGLIGPKLAMRCKETLILKITEQDAALLLSKEYMAHSKTGDIPRFLTFIRQKPLRRNLISRLLGSNQKFVSEPVLMPNISPITEINPSEPQQGSG